MNFFGKSILLFKYYTKIINISYLLIYNFLKYRFIDLISIFKNLKKQKFLIILNLNKFLILILITYLISFNIYFFQ